MINIYHLIKVQIKNKSTQKLSNNKKNEFIYYILLMISILFLLILLEVSMYRYIKFGIITISITIAEVFTILYSIKHVFFDLFYGQYFKEFIYLPIKKYEIVLSKLLVIFINPFLITLFLVGTSSLVYMILNNSKINFLLLIGFIFLNPFLNILIVIIFMCLFINIISTKYLIKFKHILSTIPLLLGIILILLIKFVDFNKTINFVEKIIFSPLKVLFLKNILNKSNFNYCIFIMILILIISLIIIKFLANMYLKSISKNLENKKKYKNKKYKSKKIIYSLIMRDLKNIIRDPMLFSNVFFRSISTSITILLLIVFKQSIILNTYNIILILYVQASFNIISITAISREGNDFNILKSMPINSKKFIISKILIGIPINLILCLITILILKFNNNINNFEVILLSLVTIIFCLYTSINCLNININNFNFNLENLNNNMSGNILKMIIMTTIELFILILFPKLFFGFILVLFIKIIYFLNKIEYIYQNIEC